MKLSVKLSTNKNKISPRVVLPKIPEKEEIRGRPGMMGKSRKIGKFPLFGFPMLSFNR